jgi:archaellum component FlaF (FlaF/FlaG flagellin family)
MKFNHSHLLFLLFAICCVTTVQAQTVKGKWYGVGNVSTSSNTNNYLCELILEQKGNVVTGEFNYFFRNGYFSNKIKGVYSTDKRQLKLNFIPMIFYKTVDAAMGVECMMQGTFTLKVSRAESTLSGSFVSDELHAYTATPINIKFTKLLKEIPFQQLVETEIEKENKDTLVRPAESPRMKLEREASIQLNMRTKEIVKELEVSEDSVRIDLYDNGDFDHDTISVFYNGQLVQHQQLLETRKPISFKVYVDSLSANNDLVMYAENLGTIPPNSALMVITDKDHRYEINLTSNYQKNAAVRLRRIARKL